MLRFSENIRGETVAKTEEGKKLFAGEHVFSVRIANGKGELKFKKFNGVWFESIYTYDRCFGLMRSAWRPLNI